MTLFTAALQPRLSPSLNNLPVITVKLLWSHLYCIKLYINKGDVTWLGTHVVPNLYHDFIFTAAHKNRYFEERFCSCNESQWGPKQPYWLSLNEQDHSLVKSSQVYLYSAFHNIDCRARPIYRQADIIGRY